MKKIENNGLCIVCKNEKSEKTIKNQKKIKIKQKKHIHESTKLP
jgi:hypothetical protein